MARRKKSSKKSSEVKKIGLDELSGFSVNQFIYCLRYPDGILARGNIRHLFKTETHEFAEFVDEITGQFRISLLSDIIENPTRSQINSANSKIAFKIKKSQDKLKKK